MKALPVLALAVSVAASPAAAPSDDPSYRLYLASTAAAEASLRLHETASARRWLDEAPAAHRGWEWRHLDALADRSSARAVVGARVLDVAVSSDGRWLATAAADGTVKLWDASTLAVERPLPGHTQAAWVVAFSPDSQRLATASSDGTARVWDVATGREVLRLEGVSRGIATVAWRPDGRQIATTGWDRTSERGVWGIVKVWSPDGTPLRTIEHGVKPIVASAWSADGRIFLAGTWDDDVAVWKTSDWTLAKTLVPPKDDAYKAVQGISLGADGRRLAVGAKDGTLRVWDTEGSRLVHTLVGQAEGQSQWINDAAWLPGDRLATAGSDATLRVWDAQAGRPLQVLHGHAGPITSVAATPDGRRLFTGSGDGTVRAWDLEALDPARWTWRLPGSAYGLAFSPDGRRAAATGWGGWVRVWDASTGRERLSWTGHEQSGVRAAWSRDGRWLATTGNDGRVVLWDAESGRPGATLLATKGQIASVSFSSDSRHVAAPADAGEVRVWRVPGGELAATLKDGERSVWHVAWSPDGRTLAASGSDGATVLWDWRAGQARARLDHGRGRVVADYHPDGSVLATGSSGRLVTLWDAASGAKVRECAGHGEAVNAVRFSPDGKRVATGADDNTLRLWDWRTCATVLSRPFPANVYDVAWSPDGRRLLVAPLDDTIVRLEARPAADAAATPRPPGIVLAHSPASSRVYLGSPSLAILPGGELVASYDEFGPGGTSDTAHVAGSRDGGATWEERAVVRGAFWSSIFVHRGALYLFGTSREDGFVAIRRSLDGGRTWTEPRDAKSGLLLADARYHTAPVPVVEHAGRLYRAFEDSMGPGGWGTSFRAFVLSAAVDADLLDAASWRASNRLGGDTAWLGGRFGGWLEGNVVPTPDGGLVDVLRVDYRDDEEKAAVVEIGAEGRTASFDPTRGFVAMPGGCKKFTIRRDPRDGSYWALANLVPPAQRGGNVERTRNTLALLRSTDLRSWKERAVLLEHPDRERHGFQYADWHFDGDDLVAVVRTAFDDPEGGAHSGHDANFVTFHRFPGFRRAKGR